MSDGPVVDRLIVDAASPALRAAGRVITPSSRVAEALRDLATEVAVEDPATAPPGSADAVALLDNELSAAGEHAEALVEAAVRAIRAGGTIAVSARSLTAPSAASARPYSSEELRRVLGHRGVTVQLLTAPGAFAQAAGAGDVAYDEVRDRMPGLLDAAPRLLAVGSVPGSAAERTTNFFSTLPRKVVAAAVICRNEAGQLLVVHDSFKRYWTIPGGVVDADEDPRSAAVREAWEEAGVRVRAGAVLGVFSASWPDRIILIYGAEMDAGAEHRFTPVHTHEIDAVEWRDLDEALRTLAPHIAQQVRACLDDPGGTMVQGMA